MCKQAGLWTARHYFRLGLKRNTMLCPLELSSQRKSFWIINKLKKDQLSILLGSRLWNFSPSLGRTFQIVIPILLESPTELSCPLLACTHFAVYQLSTLLQVPKMPSWTSGHTKSPTSRLPHDLFFASALAIDLFSLTQLNCTWEQGSKTELSLKCCTSSTF